MENTYFKKHTDLKLNGVKLHCKCLYKWSKEGVKRGRIEVEITEVVFLNDDDEPIIHQYTPKDLETVVIDWFRGQRGSSLIKNSLKK